MSSTDFEITDSQHYQGKTWWELRPYLVQMPHTSWVKIKAFIIKVCKKSGKCGGNITDWQRTVKKIDEKVIKE